MKSLTTGDVVRRLATLHQGRVNLVGEYRRHRDPCSFVCDKGHRWSVTAGSVLGGRGCPACGKRSSGDKRIIPRAEAERKIKAAHSGQIRMVGEYITFKGRSEFECNAGHRFNSQVRQVARGDGCLTCRGVMLGLRNRRPIEAVLSDIHRVHGDAVKLAGTYLGWNKKVEFRCSCGHAWSATPANVIYHGSGCPMCAPRIGFDRRESGRVYYLRVRVGETSLYKIGVTNEPSATRRFRRFKADLDRITVLKEWDFESGNEAWAMERSVLSEHRMHRYRGPAILIGGGNTELFVTDVLGLNLSR